MSNPSEVFPAAFDYLDQAQVALKATEDGKLMEVADRLCDIDTALIGLKQALAAEADRVGDLEHDNEALKERANEVQSELDDAKEELARSGEYTLTDFLTDQGLHRVDIEMALIQPDPRSAVEALIERHK